MIRLSDREMAQYLISDETDRLRLLRARKYIAPEAVARAQFYAEARTSIWAYHRGSLSRDMVEARIRTMRAEAKHANPFQRSELLNNAIVLDRYLHHQGRRTLDLAPTLATSLVKGDVEIAIRPTMFAIEDENTRRIIFLELRENSSPEMMRMIAELAFEAFRPVLRGLPPQAIQVIDVRTGFIHELQQPDPAFGHDLAEACKRISALWPHLAPPRGTQRGSRPLARQMSIAWDFDA
jgi:hypothetical protein